MMDLFNISFDISASAHQSNLEFQVNVPEQMESLSINFTYSPIEETDQHANLLAVLREGYEESLVDEETILRNLLTLSISDPEQYRGSHHYFSSNQQIELSEDKATLGFVKGAIRKGRWKFTVSCHACISSEIHCSLHIQGIPKLDPIVERRQVLSTLKKERMLIERSPIKSTQKILAKAELHTHTVHSDAIQTLEELLTQAVDEGIDYLGITDHNTISALQERNDKQWLKNMPLNILPGIEYTTYFGHFLVHGHIPDIVKNWTDITRENIQPFLGELNASGAYITIAHPFDMGNPFCTGCQWEYTLENLDHVHSIEVWNGTNPQSSLSNVDAYAKWVQLLQDGYEVNASCGRDWHRPTNSDETKAYMYIVAESTNQDAILQSLKQGRTFISTQPILDMWVNSHFTFGDRVLLTDHSITLSLNAKELSNGDQIDIYAGKEIVYSTIAKDKEFQVELNLQNFQSKFIRVEVKNNEDDVIAFSNPIYFRIA